MSNNARPQTRINQSDSESESGSESDPDDDVVSEASAEIG